MEFKTLYLDFSVTFGLKANNCRHVLWHYHQTCGISVDQFQSLDSLQWYCYVLCFNALCVTSSDISELLLRIFTPRTHKAIHVFCGKAIEKPFMKSQFSHTIHHRVKVPKSAKIAWFSLSERPSANVGKVFKSQAHHSWSCIFYPVL